MRGKEFFKSVKVGILGVTFIVIIIRLAAWWAEPKCAFGGCNEERRTESEYCYIHDVANKRYGDPRYADVSYRWKQHDANKSK